MGATREIRCPECSAKASSGAKFCESCGAGLGGDDGSPAAAIRTPRLALVVVVTAALVGLVFAIASLREKREAPQGQKEAPRAPAIDFVKKRQAEEKARGLENATRQNPDDPTAWLALAEARYELLATDPGGAGAAATVDAGIEAVGKALALSPGNAEALKLKGNIYYDSGRAPEAILAYREYLQAVPDDPNVRTDLGTMYLDANQVDEGIAEYQKVLADHPDFVNAQFNLGHAYQRKGDIAKAREAYEKVKVSPDVDEGLRRRADLFIQELEKQVVGGKGEEAGKGMAGLPEGHPPMAGTGGPAAPASPKPGGTLRADVEAVFTANPVFGPKITKVEWASDSTIQITLKDFPIEQMPADHMKKFSDRVAEARRRYGVETPVHIEFLNDAGGEVQGKIEG